MTAIHHGVGHEIINQAMPIVTEYIDRKRLSSLGITIDQQALGPFMCEAFLIIDSELDRLRKPKDG